jgi:16S rRNA (cytosine967-C5)-methyltransferase
MRLGLYQMIFLERIPPHAAVDESVKLARATGNSRSTGFVNGVLRSIGRDLAFSETADPGKPRQSFPVSPTRAVTFGKPVLPPPAQTAAYLAALHSFPIELATRWLGRYGTSKARELCSVANDPAPTFVRPNLSRVTVEQLLEKLRAEGVEASLSPSGRTVRLPHGVLVSRLGSFKAGLLQVQDDSSAAVGVFLGPESGENILDLCAAPGGKTCHIAELMGNKGMIAAVDSSAKRLQRVVENSQRLDERIIATIEADGVEFARQQRGKFDRVLLDAPCSNTGVLRRRVEARWRFSAASLAEIVSQQRALLAAALLAVRPGGTVVYSTCSLEPEENHDLVAAVLRAAPGFALDAEEHILPTRDGGDGIFMARTVRRA